MVHVTSIFTPGRNDKVGVFSCRRFRLPRGTHSIKLDTHTLARLSILSDLSIDLFVSLRFKKTFSVDTAFDCDFVIVDFVNVHYNEIKIDQY